MKEEKKKTTVKESHNKSIFSIIISKSPYIIEHLLTNSM